VLGLKHRSLSVLILFAGGCATVNPESKVREAIDLVEQRTGQKPAWTVPWDEQPPKLDVGTILGMQDAVGMALHNNRQLRADLEMIGQANADLVQAGLLKNPMFDFMIMFPDGGGRTMLRSTALPIQALQDLWLIPARKEAADAMLQQAILRVADTAVETAMQVKTAYARLQYTQRAIELTQENKAIVDQSTRLIEVRQTAGQATQVEANMSRIRSLRLRSELIAMQAEYRALQRELLMLMGFAQAGDSWRVEPLREGKDAPEAPAEENALLTLAADQRLDLKAAEWNVRAAQAVVRRMHLEAWPEVGLGFSFERAPAPRSRNLGIPGQVGNAAAQGVANGLTGMTPQPSMVDPFRVMRREVTYTLGPMIEMELPIFDQNQAQIAKAFHEFRRRLAEYEARGQEISRKVREARVMYAQACEQLQFYRDSVMPEVERNLQLAQQSFVAGRENLTVYLQVQEDLIMTRLKMLEFLRDSLVRRAELERQVGGRLEAATPDTQPAAPEQRSDLPAAAAPAASQQPVHASYTCPMHPDVRQDAPGKCPKCGMNLVVEKLTEPPATQPAALKAS
jgi:cobalt-zinc-cadmium efflux system outer membrane protein